LPCVKPPALLILVDQVLEGSMLPETTRPEFMIN